MKTRTAVRNVPEPAQDILTILDVILRIISVAEAIYTFFTRLFGTT